MSSKANSNGVDSNSKQDPLEGEWQPTPHDGVYYAPDTMRFGRGELVGAVIVSKAFPEWDIVITVGPHRAHDAQYEIRPDHEAIHLDFYSVRPGLNYLNHLIKCARKGIEELEEEGVSQP